MRDAGALPLLIFTIYTQLFTVAMGRLPRELTKPYVYLVPEPPFQKLMACVYESLPGFLLEGLLIFIPAGLLIGLSPAEIAVCVLLRFSTSCLFLAGNLVAERVFGSVSQRMLMMLFYILTLIVMLLPGLVLAIVLNVVGATVISGLFTGCLAMAVLNLPIAVLCVFLCRNLLERAELNN